MKKTWAFELLITESWLCKITKCFFDVMKKNIWCDVNFCERFFEGSFFDKFVNFELVKFLSGNLKSLILMDLL